MLAREHGRCDRSCECEGAAERMLLHTWPHAVVPAAGAEWYLAHGTADGSQLPHDIVNEPNRRALPSAVRIYGKSNVHQLRGGASAR